MNPLSLALNGLTPGASPLQISTQGLLITIQPTSPQDALWVPLRSFGPPPKRQKNCLVQVTGCRGTLTATDQNVAAAMPTMQEVDRLDDVAYEFLRRAEARKVASKIEAEIQQSVWEHFQERDARLQKIEIERRLFNEGLTKFRADLKAPTDDHANLTALCFAMSSKVGELRRQIRGMEEAVEKSKPRAKKSR